MRAFAVFGFVAALGVAALPLRARAAALDAVMALPAVSLSFSTEYLAEDMGFFAKHGVHVKPVEITGVGAFNAVISGSADFAMPSGASLTRAAAHGQRLLAIVEALDRPIVQVALRKPLAPGFDPKAPLAERARLLRGRTIAVDGIGSVIDAYVRLLAYRGGFSPDDIRVAVMEPPNMIAAFAAKQIDGFAMSPPWPLKPVLEGSAVMVASGPDGDPSDLVPLTNTIIVTRPETCAKREALCEGVGRAFADAAAFIRDHPKEAFADLQKRFPKLDTKLLAASFEVIRKITPVPPAVSLKGLENTQSFDIDAGLMKKDQRLKSYDGLYTDKYVR